MINFLARHILHGSMFLELHSKQYLPRYTHVLRWTEESVFEN
jgi:hypothetical protein